MPSFGFAERGHEFRHDDSAEQIEQFEETVLAAIDDLTAEVRNLTATDATLGGVFQQVLTAFTEAQQGGSLNADQNAKIEAAAQAVHGVVANLNADIANAQHADPSATGAPTTQTASGVPGTVGSAAPGEAAPASGTDASGTPVGAPAPAPQAPSGGTPAGGDAGAAQGGTAPPTGTPAA